MSDQVPRGKLRRGLIGGKTAARVGANMVKHVAAKPFMNKEAVRSARDKVDKANAQAVFACLSLLKGTALKIAQMLSLEMEIFPESVREELKKSYNQVPPMNRALAHKAAANALNASPGDVFASFDTSAFAAASLGQVHAALSPEGEKLAVKIQYPGIKRTIEDDLLLVRRTLGPLPDFRLIAPVLDEIEARLREEIDYENEAGNMAFFRENLKLEHVRVPKEWKPGSGRVVLSATRLEGLPLNQWMETKPSMKAREIVAARLNEIFLESFYTLRCIHADPNPGNYIIAKDLSVGLVDFGCVKSFTPEFVELYRKLPRTIIKGHRDEYFDVLRQMDFIKHGLDAKTEEAIYECAYAMGGWLGRLYETEYFDFGKEKEFLGAGREISKEMLKHRKNFTSNPEFVFLDRTRYGLLRLFQQLGCRVRIRNNYEWDVE